MDLIIFYIHYLFYLKGYINSPIDNEIYVNGFRLQLNTLQPATFKSKTSCVTKRQYINKCVTHD